MCIACSPFGAVLGAGASRRAVLGGTARLTAGAVAGFGSLFACAAVAQPAGTAAGPADVIYSGGPILTMNDAAPSAEAVAVRGGRILAVAGQNLADKLPKGSAPLSANKKGA